MLFNSIDFAIFLPLVFLLFWAVPSKQQAARNWIILIASYVFYGWWDVRFLSLIMVSTMLDYWIGRSLAGTTDERRRRWLLWASIGANLGLLGFFKYWNFFLDQVNGAFSFLGMSIHGERLNIILPVGISFYTFQTLSYTIDVYRGQLKPSKDPVAFAAFVAFFPQLVAGPIERARNLLPQFTTPRLFDRSAAVDGSRQILWGFFKKLVIADACAEQVDLIFDASSTASGSTLLLGAVYFAFQIYGDFSGYSDIAIGVSRLFGFSLMKNFAFPYFSRDIAEFWRRWHISLTTWFRDYLYVPLGGSRGGMTMRIRNTFIIFLVSGAWHGANWTFLAWGALNALYFIPLLVTGNNRKNIGSVAEGRMLPTFQEVISMGGTFLITCIAWIFFRARDVDHAIQYSAGMLSGSLFTVPSTTNRNLPILILVLLLIEWQGRATEHALERLALSWSRPMRWIFYCGLITLIGLFMRTEEAPFLYFQF